VPVEMQLARLLRRDGIDRGLAERMVAAHGSALQGQDNPEMRRYAPMRSWPQKKVIQPAIAR
jgi:hypothetical protein